MSRFKQTARQVPGLNTSSLPDLIFSVLFFFMIVTHMRKVTLKVKYQTPAGTELRNLTKKSTVSYIYIGAPINGNMLPDGAAQAAGEGAEGQKSIIQLNDKIVSVGEIAPYLAAERRSMSDEDLQQMMVSVKADRQTDMGLITDVKQALRIANVLKVNYSAVSDKRSDR